MGHLHGLGEENEVLGGLLLQLQRGDAVEKLGGDDLQQSSGMGAVPSWDEPAQGRLAGKPAVQLRLPWAQCWRPNTFNTDDKRYISFYYNSTTFVASVVVILMVQIKALLTRNALHAAMIFDLFGLMGAYIAEDEKRAQRSGNWGCGQPAGQVEGSRLQPLATSGAAPGRYVTSGPVGGGAMGIYERQRHLVAAGVWGEPFRPDADAVALPLPRPLAAVAPTVTVATTPAPLDVVEAEEVKFGKRLLQAQQDDVAPPVEEEAPPPPSDSFGHDDDARPRDKVRRTRLMSDESDELSAGTRIPRSLIFALALLCLDSETARAEQRGSPEEPATEEGQQRLSEEPTLIACQANLQQMASAVGKLADLVDFVDKVTD
ncbi:unnamed protein product [Miscanthus lutarioriparius]|uniref:Uncharacterized protein n=1 Tax=Miscanthus lutarioriparius TaxID=422564 RepID=A0A811SQH3_9POAL|nr:unnamed protein product [Miscanthus lutarioriparius]